MTRAAVFALALVGGSVSAQYCLSEYNCQFNYNINGQEWRWDLSRLCDPTGAGYVTQNQAAGLLYNFNICGSVKASCIPTWPVYSNQGSFVQFFGATPAPTGGCLDINGNPANCTADCAVLGTNYFNTQLMDSTKPDAGIIMNFDGMPPDTQDPFICQAITTTGLMVQRQTTLQLTCDPNVAGLNVISFGDNNGDCHYIMKATSSAACGARVTPPSTSTGGLAFGMVVLGSAITIIMYLGIGYGNRRGWFDGIKARVPASCKRVSGMAGLGGSAYKTITPPAATASTPITGYGTA